MLRSRRPLSLLAVASLVRNTSAFFVAPPVQLASTAAASSVSTRLIATTAATSSSTGKMADTGEILEPQGKHYPWYSLGPLTEAGQWSASPGTYFKKLTEENGGAPIYKAHPGLACIALTDYASGEWFFNQPETVLDRQDGAYFGPLKCTKEYVGTSLPALVTNMKEAHAAVRKYTLSLLMERLGSVQSAWSHSSDNFYKNLWANGLKDYNTLYDVFLQQSYSFMLEWLLATGEEGGQPLPPFKDFLNVNPSDINVLLKLEIDTPVANAVGNIAQALAGGITSEQKASVNVLLDSIRSSRMWPKFVEMMKEQKVDISELERSFMFNTGFQSSAAISKNMEFAVGALSVHRDFLEELRQELDGKELNMKNIDSVTDFPLLDSFHWEILRFCPAPPFFFKAAKMDLLVPTNSGAKYQIRKGDMLCCHQPLMQIDTAKFGPDAKEINPRRFLENPEMKKAVKAYAFSDSSNPVYKEGNPWGCAAHAAGMLDSTIKLFYARWVQEAEWELEAPAVIDAVDYLGSVGPEGISFSKITPRK